MTQTISFRFTPNKNDYINGIRAYYLSNSRFKLMVILAGIFELFMIIAILAGSFGNSPWAWVIALLMPALLVYLLILGPLRVGRQVEKSERFTSETVWEVGDSRILIKNEFAELKMDWGSFEKIVERGDYYLLIYTTNKRMFQIIPKRAFESQEQETAFREFLKQKVQIQR